MNLNITTQLFTMGMPFHVVSKNFIALTFVTQISSSFNASTNYLNRDKFDMPVISRITFKMEFSTRGNTDFSFKPGV